MGISSSSLSHALLFSNVQVHHPENIIILIFYFSLRRQHQKRSVNQRTCSALGIFTLPLAHLITPTSPLVYVS